MVDVITDGDTKQALAYVASADATDAARRPYHWYKSLVVTGAIQHRLRLDDTARLRAIESQADPIPGRRTKVEAASGSCCQRDRSPLLILATRIRLEK